MEDTKPAIASLGIIGPLVVLIVAVSQSLGVDISDLASPLPDLIAGMIGDGLILGGALAGIYGRWRASAKITGLFKAR